MARSRLQQAQVRDFSGGWNVSDTDLNLVSKYQPVSDNILRGSDGSFTLRWGTKLFVDTGKGTVTDHGLNAFTQLETTNTQPYIVIAWTGHPFSNGEHITISGAVDVGGIPAADINRTHGILVVDVDNFKIPCRTAASSTTTLAATVINATQDTHACGGNIIHKTYFNRKLICYTDIGEVFTVDGTGVIARIWDYSFAEALTSGLVPTRECKQISTTSWKSNILSVNGYDRDKPLKVTEDFSVEYLVDAATSSNAHVPRADYILSVQGYIAMVRTEYGDTMVEFSAAGTDGTFTREASPADSVEVNVGALTSTVDPILLGVSKIRNKMFVAFYDQGMLGTVGTESGGTHDPDFSDTIAEHGTVSHRTMAPLGNDILMADYAGVVSVGLSVASGVYVPTRISAFIAPAIQAHLASLSETTLQEKSFSVFNRSDRTYMLFVPKCDEVVQALPTDAISFRSGLSDNNRVLVRADNHNLFEGSKVTVAGVTGIGSSLAASYNGVRVVYAVVDKDYFVMEVDDTPSSSLIISGGGSSITITPVNDETICYAFEFNKELGIRRWTRLRDMNFDCACISQRGSMFVSKGKKIYLYGSSSNPYTADFVDDYDEYAWVVATAYAVGNRVLDSTDNTVYICDIAHTSAGSGTFSADRDANVDNWSEYLGESINFALETPWSDLNKRGSTKVIKSVVHDAIGDGEYTFSIFTSKIYKDSSTYELAPKRSMDFMGQDAPGFGKGDPLVFGSGRRTKEENIWPMPCKGKLFKLRYSGATKRSLRIVSTTMYYMSGNNVHQG